MPDSAPFPVFVSMQLEELRLRLLTEFERLHGNSVDIEKELHRLDLQDAGASPGKPRVQSVKKDEVSSRFTDEVRSQCDAMDQDITEGTDEGQQPMDVRAIEVRTNCLQVLNRDTRRSQTGALVDPADEAVLSHLPRQPLRQFSSENTSQVLGSHALGSHHIGSNPFGGSREMSMNSGKQSANEAIAEEFTRNSGSSELSDTETISGHSVDSDVPDRCCLLIWCLRLLGCGHDVSDLEAKRRFSNASLSMAEAAMRKDTFSGNGIINPMSMAYSNWSNFISVLVIFSCFLTPFRFGFLPSFGPVDYIDTVLDIIFGLDIVLTFNVAVMTKEGIEFVRRKIFLTYALSLRFFIDVVATVPFDVFWTAVSDTSNPTNQDIAQVMGLLRLLRVNRLLILFRKLQKNTYFNLVGVVVAKFVVFILLCTHTSGCIFYKLAQHFEFGQDTWVFHYDPELPNRNLATRYIRALFWAVGTFKAGPTSGALGPTSNSEMLLACLTMMVNICLATYLVSNMAALLTTTDVKIYNMRTQLMQIREFGVRYKLPRELQFQLMAFVRFKFSTHDEVDQSLLSGLPDMYRQRINYFLFEEIIRSVGIFKSCASVFLRQLHGSFKAALYMPDQQLATIDGPCSNLQILAEGEVELLHRGGGVIDFRGEGECFTAVSFLCKVGQPYSVRSRMVCRVLSLGDSAWEAACTAFPESLQQVRLNLLTHCKEKVAEHMPTTIGFTVYTEVLETVNTHLVQQEELSISMICSSAARGDIADLKRRLVLQSPNCSNFDRRTPLHLAAAHGQAESARALLDAEAEVDPIDNFGRTPLFEACRARQDQVTHLLHARGAKLGKGRVDRESSAEVRNETEQASAAGELCAAASDVSQLWYLKALLQYDADPNAGDYDQRTALHLANASGNRAAVQLLLHHPLVNINPRDNFGRTPLMEAVRHGHEECARAMKSVGAFHGFVTDFSQANGDSNAVGAGQELCQAAFANQANYLHNLIHYCGINVDAADYDKRTALMLASAEGNLSVAVSLVRNKADVNRKDRWGHTAVSEAEEHGHTELAKVLKLMSTDRNRH